MYPAINILTLSGKRRVYREYLFSERGRLLV